MDYQIAYEQVVKLCIEKNLIVTELRMDNEKLKDRVNLQAETIEKLGTIIDNLNHVR